MARSRADSEASAENLVAALKSAFEDAGAQAVVLRINSPGGSPVQAGIINDEIRRLKALHKKKVYAVFEEICASGAYYIAVAADEIYVDKASSSAHRRADGRLRFHRRDGQAGRERRLMTAGENKGMLDPFSPLTGAQRVRAGHARPDPPAVHPGGEGRPRQAPEGDADTFSGLFWNGEAGGRQGLADQLGSLDYVAREVVKAEEIIDYTPQENVAERLAKRFGASIGAGAVKALLPFGLLR